MTGYAHSSSTPTHPSEDDPIVRRDMAEVSVAHAVSQLIDERGFDEAQAILDRITAEVNAAFRAASEGRAA